MAFPGVLLKSGPRTFDTNAAGNSSAGAKGAGIVMAGNNCHRDQIHLAFPVTRSF